MAVVDTYSDGTPIVRAGGDISAGYPDRVFLRNTINMAKTDGAAIADTVELITIPAGTVVEDILLEVVLGEATVTVALGVTGDDPDGFIEATLIATGAKIRGDGAYLADVDGDVAKTAYFATETVISALVAAAALEAAELKVTVVGYNFG